MRVGVCVAAVLCVALAACSPKAEKAADGAAGEAPAAATPLSYADMPTPKLGKWKMTMNIPGAPGPQNVEVCYTPEMIAQLKALSGKVPNSECSDPAVTRDLGGYNLAMSCTTMGEKSNIAMRYEGDFNSRYTSTMTSNTEPPTPQAETKVTTVAEYLGPC